MGARNETNLAITELLETWQIGGPCTIQEVIRGGNNLSYRVATPAGEYFLRVYENTADIGRILYEHAVLAQLGEAKLSFQVPLPVVSLENSTIVELNAEDTQRLAALFPLIGGRQPDGDNLAEFRAAGIALAELDQALSRINVPTATATFPPFGYFSQIHTAVADPAEMLDRIALSSSQRSDLARIMNALEHQVPVLYRTLPQQIVHRDFDASNVLMWDQRVVGVLDFEFVGPDLRAIDLARSLALFTLSPWSHPEGLEWVSAFAEGFRQHIVLTSGETDALPEMIRLYHVVSLIHREGRRRQGLATEEDVGARAVALLRGDEWLTRNHGRLKAILSL